MVCWSDSLNPHLINGNARETQINAKNSEQFKNGIKPEQECIRISNTLHKKRMKWCNGYGVQ